MNYTKLAAQYNQSFALGFSLLCLSKISFFSLASRSLVTLNNKGTSVSSKLVPLRTICAIAFAQWRIRGIPWPHLSHLRNSILLSTAAIQQWPRPVNLHDTLGGLPHLQQCRTELVYTNGTTRLTGCIQKQHFRRFLGHHRHVVPYQRTRRQVAILAVIRGLLLYHLRFDLLCNC